MQKRLILAFMLVGVLATCVGAQPPVLTTPVSTDEIVLPTYEGRIDVAPGGRYFVDEAGEGFLVIGQNDAISWSGLNSLFNGTSPEQTEFYISDLRDHGITVSRIMMEYAQQPESYMENPVGEFSDEVLAFWDAFIPMAEENDLYLLLTPYDTFWQSDNWDTYPYNAEVGGPCEERSDWLTGRECIDAQKDRWRLIIERWGDSDNIFAWDLMNEVDLWWEVSADEIEDYITEMAAFVRDTEKEVWGETHLITVSSAEAVPGGQLGRIIYQHPDLDFATTHLYIGETTDPPNPILSGPIFGGGVALSLEALNDDRPYFDSESGPINDWIVDPQFDQEYHHNMSWAHLAACGAGTGMRWPYTNPHFILPELRDNLLGIARVASTIDWANFVSDNITNRMRMSDRKIFRVGCSDGDTALIWLLADRRQDETVSIPGKTLIVRDIFEDALHTVEYYEPYSGTFMDEDEVEVIDGVFELVIPDFDDDLRDLALVVRSQGEE